MLTLDFGSADLVAVFHAAESESSLEAEAQEAEAHQKAAEVLEEADHHDRPEVVAGRHNLDAMEQPRGVHLLRAEACSVAEHPVHPAAFLEALPYGLGQGPVGHHLVVQGLLDC